MTDEAVKDFRNTLQREYNVMRWLANPYLSEVFNLFFVKFLRNKKKHILRNMELLRIYGKKKKLMLNMQKCPVSLSSTR